MSRVAKRYAKALFQLGVEEKKLEQLENDLTQMENLLKESEDFSLFTANPLISESEKAKILAKLFKGKLSDTGYNFLQLLTSKKRSSFLPDCIEQFRLLLDEHRNILKG
ncbi:MAG TPA: ATP synthase F1 subunit delta, partial [Caldithrix sp.]|nr:ATP synthase F1 subunit delta [Caldithrix sp.]